MDGLWGNDLGRWTDVYLCTVQVTSDPPLCHMRQWIFIRSPSPFSVNQDLFLSVVSIDLPVQNTKNDRQLWATFAHIATYSLSLRGYGYSSQAVKRGVSLESSGLRFSSSRSVRSTSHSLKFTDAPGSCRLSTGLVPTAIFHDPLWSVYLRLHGRKLIFRPT